MRDPEPRIDPPETEEKTCPRCGFAWPVYQVEDINHVILGCERCLLIMRNGAIQL